MEEEKLEKTFTEKEVMDMVERMQNDHKAKMQRYAKTINELNGTLTRLDFLVQIVNSKNIQVFSTDFISNCAKEIESIMSIPEEDSDNTKQE